MNQLLHFVNTVVVLYWIIWDDKYVFLDCIGLLLTAADTIHCLYSMAVQDRNMKRDFVDVKVLSLCFLVLGLCITVFNICAFFLGVAGSACRTLSVPRFLEVLFWNPGDSSVVTKLLSFAFSRCLLTRSLVCSLIFFRLSSSAARLFSLISFALLPFWAFFMVNEPRVCGRESDSRPWLRLSLVFSTFPDLFHNMPYFFLSFLLFPLAPQFFYAKDCDIGSPCCIPWSLEWTHARTWKNENVTFSSRYAIQRPWICQTSTPCIDIKHVRFFGEEKRVKSAEFGKIHGRLEMVCATLHTCCSFVTLCEHGNFTRKCFSFIQSRISRVLWCQKS